MATTTRPPVIVTYQTSNLIAPCCHKSHKTDGMATPERDGFAFLVAAYTATAVTRSHQHDDLDRREAARHPRPLSTRDLVAQAKDPDRAATPVRR